MSALQFTKRSGEIVSRAYVARRVRAYCRPLVAGQAEWKANLDKLLASYGEESQWWRRRNGYLVEALCRDAFTFAVYGDDV